MEEDTTPEGQTGTGQVEPQAETKRELTFGEKAVGLTFNPSKGSEIGDRVNRVKTLSAQLIDELAHLEGREGMTKFLRNGAMHQMILAQMAIVKVITWTD